MEIFNVVSDPSSNYIAVGFSKDDLMVFNLTEIKNNLA